MSAAGGAPRCTAAAAAPTSPPSPPAAAAAAAAPAPGRRWRLRDAAGSLATLLADYGAEGVGLLVPTLGGAVDIVVVRQPDGSLRSSPFYVRFGKYQGVLRRRAKRVEVWVNGSKTRLFMLLGRNGEAYFADDALADDTAQQDADAEANSAVAAAQDAAAEAAADALEVEDALFAAELDDAERATAEQQSLVSRLDALTGAAEAGGGDAPGSEGESESDAEGADAADELAGSASGSLSSTGDGFASRWAFWRARGSGGAEAPAASAAAATAATVPPLSVARRPLQLPRADGSLLDVYATPRGVPEEGPEGRGWGRADADVSIDEEAQEADDNAALAAAIAEDDAATARAQLVPGCAALSLCGDDASAGAFERHALSREAFAADAAALVADPRLRLRVGGGPPAPLRAALPPLLALLAYGVPLPEAPEPADAADAAADTADAAADAGAAAQPATDEAAPPRRTRRRLRPSAEEIDALGLSDGRNIVSFVLNTKLWGRQEVCAQAFVWQHDAKVVISDIDGTITRSDLMGHVMPIIGRDWAHDGVAALYNAIAANGYQLAFLSARSVGQADTTRSYLRGLHSSVGGAPLAPGPVILAPDGITTALVRELIRRAPAEFKIACLTDIRGLFPADWNPFYAGFGNRGSDVISYAAVGVPRGRTFTINPRGELSCEAVAHTRRFTLPALASLLHEFFPPVGAAGGGREEFGDVAFWRRDVVPLATSLEDDPQLAALLSQAGPVPGGAAPPR